jgi:hypothetical protein
MFTHLDLRTRSRFIIAGLIYVGAALGMEMLEGPIDEHFGTNALPGITAEFVEETLEMLGVILFLNALLQYLATHVDEVRICFENRAAERSASLSHDSTSPLPEPTSSEAAFWEEEMSDLVLIANKRGRESSSDRRC